jgi:hypothetical protein
MLERLLEYDISWLENASTIGRDKEEMNLWMSPLHPCPKILVDVHTPVIN